MISPAFDSMFTHHTVSVNGIQLRYVRAGQGELEGEE
jgi:hypothetical protein